MEITQRSTSKTNCYHLPHHAVRKENITSTKLRVVFDATAKKNIFIVKTIGNLLRSRGKEKIIF